MKMLAGGVVGALVTLAIVLLLRGPPERPRHAGDDHDEVAAAAVKRLLVPVPVAVPVRLSPGGDGGGIASVAAPAVPPRRPPPTNPDDERKMFLDRVRRDGRSDEPWTREAAGLFRATEGHLAKGLEGKVQWSSVECHEIGCIATASCSDGLAYEKLDQDLRANQSPLAGWPGIHYRSPPARLESGAVQASWVLFRPGFDPGELQQ